MLTATAGYAIVVWVLLQIAEVTFEPLYLPDWAMTALVVAAIAGFPVVAVLSWFFDLTRRGVQRDAGDVVADRSGQGMDDAGAVRSIAVLPFDDMSPEQDQEYFCNGIAEEILNRLTGIGPLRVASRTSSFRYKGRAADIGTIGRDLHVGSVLAGSVRKSGSRMRISTQLVNTADGYHQWSQTFDQVPEDIFAIQDEIASQVAAALKVTLTGKRLDGTTRDAHAYEHYLRGLDYFHRWGQRNVEYAVEMFRRAVERDPGYAVAWAALADCHAFICMYWSVSEEHVEAAVKASEKALELAPGLAEAHVSRGLAHTVRRLEAEAVAEFEAAIELDPDLFAAWYFFGRVLFQRGDLEGAARRFEQAERVRPDDFHAPILLRQIYESQGRQEEAMEAARRGVDRARRHLELNPDDTRALNLGIGGLAMLGEREAVYEWADRTLRIDGRNADTLYNVACAFALIGDKERALDCLERAGLEGMLISGWAENDSDLASLHDDPRFVALMRRLRAVAGTGADPGADQL